MDEHRWTEAQREIGRRHPYWTVYGRRIVGAVILTAGGTGMWTAWNAGIGVPIAVLAVATVAGIVAWVLR